MNPFGAYIHARPDGTAFYVGKGRRSRAHNLRPRNPHHGNIISKYGKDQILVSFLPCSTEATAFELEIGLIKTFARNGITLTNRTDGGEGCSGLIWSASSRAKLSASNIGRTHTVETRIKLSSVNKGRTRTQEARAKMSAVHTGKLHTEEAKAKISAGNKGKIVSAETCAKISAAAKGNQYGKGYTQSESARLRIGAAQKGKIVSEETRAKLSAASKAQWAKRREQV